MGTPCAIYRCYAEDDRLLYVGISTDPLRRAAQHYNSTWLPYCVKITLEWHKNRYVAGNAELLAIKNEKPEYNVVGLHLNKRLWTKAQQDEEEQAYVEAMTEREWEKDFAAKSGD